MHDNYTIRAPAITNIFKVCMARYINFSQFEASPFNSCTFLPVASVISQTCLYKQCICLLRWSNLASHITSCHLLVFRGWDIVSVLVRYRKEPLLCQCQHVGGWSTNSQYWITCLTGVIHCSDSQLTCLFGPCVHDVTKIEITWSLIRTKNLHNHHRMQYIK